MPTTGERWTGKNSFERLAGLSCLIKAQQLGLYFLVACFSAFYIGSKNPEKKPCNL